MKMDVNEPGWRGFFFFLLVLFILAGCSGGSTGPAVVDLSTMTEGSSESKNLAAAAGGTVAHDAVTVTFPAGILPSDATIKVSKANVSDSEDDPDLVDMTDAYVISDAAGTKTLELSDSANIVFKVNPAGFDETSIRLVIWTVTNGMRFQLSMI